MDLLNINTVSELNSALSSQRTATRQALLELDAVHGQLFSIESEEKDEMRVARILLDKEVRLLERYSSRPSLREFQLPYMQGFAKEGGTFGTVAIVGEVILQNICAIESRFARVHRFILMLILREIDDPSAEVVDLIDVVLRFMRIELKQELDTLPEPERQRLLRGLMRPLVEATILVLQQYRIVESPDNQGWRLTAMGRRVMLHLFDAQKFIEHIAETHLRLQQAGDATGQQTVPK